MRCLHQAAGVPASCRGAGPLRESRSRQIAKDLGISESCLRRWMDQARRRRRPQGGPDQRRAGRAGRAAPARTGCWRWRSRSSSGPRPTSRGRTSSQNSDPGWSMSWPRDGFPVAVACRVLKVLTLGATTSGSGRPPSARDVADAVPDRPRSSTSTPPPAAPTARRGCTPSCASGCGIRVGRKRVARLMRLAGLAGVCHRRKRRGTGPRRPRTRTWSQRRFTADRPGPALVHRHHPAPHRRGLGLLLRRARRASPAGSWAGRSPTTCAPSWSSTPCRWPAGSADPRRHDRPRRPRQPSTPPGSSATGCARPGCSARWAGSPPASTTR